MKNYKTSLTLARAAMTLAGAPTRRAAMMLLIAMLTAATGWAQDEITGLTYNSAGGYYEIPDAAALNALSTYAQSNDCAGKTFVQTADITLTGTFNPIGGNSSKNYYGFLGTYDGGGHTISGLNVSVTSTSWSFAVAGLFGGIDGGGTVRNVGLIAPSVSCSTSRDKNRAGAIAGDVQANSSVTHCFVLNPGSITASGGTTYTGLFFGAKKNNGTYANLYYYGTTSLPMCGYGDIGSNHIGQIYKVTAGTNVGLPATADETGFIAAGSHYYRQGASLELSYTGSNPNYYRPVYSVSPTGTGATVLSHTVLTVGNADITVSATLSSEQLIDIATGTLASIPDQVYTGSAITPAITLTVGGKVLTEWTDYTVTFTNNTDVGTATVTLNGEGDYAGTISKTFNIIAHSFSGSGTAASPYLVQTAADLIAIARNVNNGTAGYASAHYLQTADLDLTGCEMHSIGGGNGPYWKDPGTGTAFSGVYDGGGHSISHLTINEYGESSVGKWYVGLFGNATGATIKGVVMDNTCSVSGYSMVGGLVGYADCESTTLVGNVFCGSVSEYFGRTYGALIGYFNGSDNNTSDHFHNNYYTESASPQQAGGEGKNWTGGDLTTNNGAVRGYAITLAGGAGLAEIGTTGVTHPNYAASGETVTLATRAGYTGSFTVTDADNANVAVSGNTFTMPAKNVTIAATVTPDPAHFSVNDAGTEYTIHTAEGWGVFCDALQDNDTYNRFSGKTVKLGDNITVTRMAGGSYHDFCGTFDGQGNTLTVNISSDDITDGSTQYVAPFRYVTSGDSPATIRNLHVTGTITTDKQFTGGLIGGCWGTVIVENCRVSTAITSTISDDGTHGGIVGIQQNGSLYIHGCVFDGSLLGATTYAVGGFLGWRKSGAEIRNSLFAPAEVTVLNTSGATFSRNKVDTYNSYYTYYLCDGTSYAPYDPADADHPDKYNNGHATRTVSAGDNVTIDAVALTGDATQYTVSGITAYANGGLKCGETLYYGSGDQLSLTLSNTGAPLGYQYGYTASAGTLSGTTLTMPDEDVTITATFLSDGLPHEVSYVDADGTTATASAIALDGTETSLAAGWYFVGKDIDYTATVTLGGDVSLILADGCTMNIGSSGSRINVQGIAREASGDQALTIYGQTAGTGTLSIYTDNGKNGIAAKAVTINGGNVTIDANGEWSTGIYAGVGNIIINSGNVNVTATGVNTWGLYANANVNVNGGNVNATGGSSGIRTDNGGIALNGGNVTATGSNNGIQSSKGGITLGYTNPTDYILVSSYQHNGTAKVADGQALADESDHIYTGTLTAKQLAAIANQKLTPVNLYVINGNSDETVSFTEQKEHATVIYNRNFTKGVTSTIVLPFDFDATALAGALHTISSIGVQDGKWVATASDAIPEGKANTPYLFKPNSDIVSTTFKDVTIVPTEESTTTIGESNWQMKGVYQFKEWDADSPSDYGFAGAAQESTEGEAIKAGDFVRVGKGAKIRATRCYLTYDNGISKASPILPDRITVIFPDATASVIEPQPADPSGDTDPSGDITTPISEIAAQSGTKVWGYDGTIYIESQPYTPYTMIDLAGRTLRNGVTNSTREEVTLSRPAGIVIVRIGGKSFKIFNR